jgi:transcriptional regulator with XRE-family HTH domain
MDKRTVTAKEVAERINRATAAQVVGNVRDLRNHKRWSQAELAERLESFGMAASQPLIAQLEAGKRPTSVNELVALALALDASIDTLLEPPDGVVIQSGEHLTVPDTGPHRLFASPAFIQAERLYKSGRAKLDAGGSARDALLMLVAIEVQVTAFREDLERRSERPKEADVEVRRDEESE